jgi:Uma2 family endonuclease
MSTDTDTYQSDRRYTVEEYFEIERGSNERHEYIEGLIIPLSELLAMAGGSFNHGLIAGNVARGLGNRLQNGPCRVVQSELRVRIPRRSLYVYPDVVVVCDKPEFDPERKAGDSLTNPRIVVEVLSPSTERYDRGDKFKRYLELDSLREYVLISQVEPSVESFLRQDDGSWRLDFVKGLDAVAKFRSLSIELPMSEIYATVEFPPPDPAEQTPSSR